MQEIPETEPTRVAAGETWRWDRNITDYPASLWTLTYSFLLQSGSTRFDVVATQDGDTHQVHVPASTTAAHAR